METVSLHTLAAAAGGSRIEGDPATGVADLAYDSSAVGRGALFFCVPGARADGHAFASDAVAAGAAALVTERVLDAPVPQIVVPSSRAAMAPIAAEFFGHPSRALTLAGVTGTNGKTTTTYLLASVFEAAGMRTGLIGNIERRIDDEVLPAVRNTPEAIDLQRLLARMRVRGVEGVAMEVTSEGLDQCRPLATSFRCSVFTKLAPEHLNYHGTMEAYFRAKARLFEPDLSAHAAICTDDEWGERLRDGIEVPVTTFSLRGPADVHATAIDLDADGSTVTATVHGTSVRFRLRLPGPYNVANALGAIACAVALGIDAGVAARGVAALEGVPGRLERVPSHRDDLVVLVDYAHTADSLEGVLGATRAIVPAGGRLVVVFGCGGDRDRTKRPRMGEVAATLADRVIITSDNPRTEDPAAIVAEIEQGARGTGRPYEVCVDRRDAIASAIEDARPGDVVVIAGKGHESGQEFADRTVPFDDRTVARQILEALR